MTCSVPRCDRPRTARGLCSMHYQQWRKHGEPKPEPKPPPRTCGVDGCDSPHNSRGWCSKHYQKWQSHGDPLGRSEPKPPRTCSVPGCDSPHYGRGLCKWHYQKWRRHGDVQADAGPPPRSCSVEGCDNPRASHGRCDRHHRRWLKHGDVLAHIPIGALTGFLQQGRRRKELPHGTRSGHVYWGCQCADCYRATVVYKHGWRADNHGRQRQLERRRERERRRLRLRKQPNRVAQNRYARRTALPISTAGPWSEKEKRIARSGIPIAMICMRTGRTYADVKGFLAQFERS